MDSFHNVVNEVINNNVVHINSIDSFTQSYEYLNTLWEHDENFIINSLNIFSDTFNTQWDNDPDKKLFIKIFNSPQEIYPFIMNTIGWDCKEFIEEEISMSSETLKDTCENVYSQPFINERFIDILNINMPILF